MAEKTLVIGDRTFKEGDTITINGTSGDVIDGAPALVPPRLDDPNLAKVMGWADGFRRLKVRTNADTPHDARQAIEFGAQGIGLTRTEHMFFGEDRIMKMREMILADSTSGREKALAKLLPMQRADFRGLFETMAPRPVTIRLLDPPIHEFLPTENQLEDDLAKLRHLQESVDGMSVLAGSAMLLAEISREAEIPAGVWNTVNGFGEVAGRALTEHPAIKAVAFVGESTTGSHIMRQGAPTLKRVHFELGGKNPAVVLSDAEHLDAVLGAHARDLGGVDLDDHGGPPEHSV